MSHIIAAAFLVTHALSAYAEQPKDVHGWDKAEWGMTEDQVVAAFGEYAERHQKDRYAKCFSTVRITGFSYSNTEYRADMLFDNDSAKLTGINLRAQDEKSLNVVDEFQKQSRLLKKVFGKPSEQTPTKLIWTFQSTTISLEYKPMLGLVGINIFGVYLRQNATEDQESPTTPSTPTK